MILLSIPFMQTIPEQVPTTVIGIIGVLALMVSTFVGILVRGWLKNVSEAQKAQIEMQRAEIEIRQKATDSALEDRKADRAALMQIVGFMSALNENVRVFQTEQTELRRELLRAALRPAAQPEDK